MFADNLGDRMKGHYENLTKTKLIQEVPVIIRIDGKAFHTFTKKFEKPFDKVLVKSMQETTKYLCENIQNCIFGYTQSDEISLVLIKPLISSAVWFDYEVQKLCSVSASMATLAFMKSFHKNALKYSLEAHAENPNTDLSSIYEAAVEKGAMFDARCFNIPECEVVNCIYWRQIDAKRNSVQMLARSLYSHKQLDRKNTADLLELCKEKGQVWEDLSNHLKWGSAVKYNFETHKVEIDENMPLLKGEDRKYLEDLIVMNQDFSPHHH